MLLILIQILFASTVWGIIGYDCGTRYLNVTTLSLINIAECDIPDESIKIERKFIQLLQINEYIETHVYQCKLEIHRTVYRCGAFSHISIVTNGENEYIKEISEQSCKEAHKTGILRITDTHIINRLKSNHTVTHSIVLAGTLENDGSCEGATYSDPYGTWKESVVQGFIKITLNDYTARIALEKNLIHLRSGTICKLGEGNCIDVEDGYTFWDPLPYDICKFNRYGILYEGIANKIIDTEMGAFQTVYSLTTQDITFALTAKGKQNVCGYSLIQTEHPKLLILETSKDETFASVKKHSVSNLDIFAYMNSKFVYVERHIKTQIKQLYRDVVYQKCNLERETLKNSLTIATQSPDEFAYNLMKGPGYMAVLAGEVVHIVKCIPVEVRIEHGDSCYAELQVKRKNETYFLTPRTHILKIKGTKIACNTLLPSYYLLGETWYKILPRPTEALPPSTLKPTTKPTWKYVNPGDLANSGIYTEKDLDELRERIMFPVERPALLNDIAREINGHPVKENEGTIFKLLNEEAITKIAHSTWNKVWGQFINFGTVSAGIIAILIIIQFIKAIVNVIIRGYTLFSIFGWSIHILSALWGTLTHFIVSVSKEPKIISDIELGQSTNNEKRETNFSETFEKEKVSTYTQYNEKIKEEIKSKESTSIYPTEELDDIANKGRVFIKE